MQKIHALFTLLLLAFSACEEVIELDLDSTEQRIVVEANLDATNGNCTVLLSRSADFYERNSFDKIQGASILLRTATGDNVSLADMGDGRYSIENLAVNGAETQHLQIKLPDNQVIESDVLVTVPVSLDSLLLQKSSSGGMPGGQASDQYSLTAQWTDPPGAPHYYRLKIYKNNEFQSGTYILADDRLGDGEPISRPVIRQTFEKGDTLRCQLLTVNKGYYDYFTDLANSEGRGFSAPTPFNPKGNLTGDALGYFGVWYVSEKVIMVE